MRLENNGGRRLQIRTSSGRFGHHGQLGITGRLAQHRLPPLTDLLLRQRAFIYLVDFVFFLLEEHDLFLQGEYYLTFFALRLGHLLVQGDLFGELLLQKSNAALGI